jgi:hypothetical protein
MSVLFAGFNKAASAVELRVAREDYDVHVEKKVVSKVTRSLVRVALKMYDYYANKEKYD